MIDLQSDRWDELTSSVGGNGRYTSDLLNNIYNGQLDSYAELFHQVCHQSSVGEVAYAVVPHLIEIIKSKGNENHLRAFDTIGMIVASKEIYYKDSAEVPADLLKEYNDALEEALSLTGEALKKKLDFDDSQSLILTMAALQKHPNLALLLAQGELCCPICGEAIEF